MVEPEAIGVRDALCDLVEAVAVFRKNAAKERLVLEAYDTLRQLVEEPE